MFFRKPVTKEQLIAAKERVRDAQAAEMALYLNRPKDKMTPEEEVSCQIKETEAYRLKRQCTDEYESLWDRYKKENKL